ncbi:MAG: type II toxin-antitoxin system prevent-host-death family antitoxin [Deltaproteobacteria bacterium]|nr:type II toxin-antitoxin system prevent-host-death family antitoxin [Deltaproteobacteria bacterium]
MIVVTISELKNHLSHYLRKVRQGEAVLVRNRDRVIARIEPAGGPASAETDDARWLADLEARGVIRRGTGRLPPDWLDRAPEVDADVVAALLQEREEGR